MANVLIRNEIVAVESRLPVEMESTLIPTVYVRVDEQFYRSIPSIWLLSK